MVGCFSFADRLYVFEASLFDGVSVWRAIVDGWQVLFFEGDGSLVGDGLAFEVLSAWIGEGLNV